MINAWDYPEFSEGFPVKWRANHGGSHVYVRACSLKWKKVI